MSDSSSGFRYNLLDDFNREALAIEVTSLRAERVVRVFGVRHPVGEVNQNESGLTMVLNSISSKPAYERTFHPAQFIQPGKPTQNAYIERFNQFSQMMLIYLNH